jgi:hypothetical protein
MMIVLSICKKENIKQIILSDTSYLLCRYDKILLMYLRTLTKREPYYCKFGFTPKYDYDINVWNYNKKKFLENPTLTKDELVNIIMYRKFDENNSNDKKILYHINNNVIPKLKNTNVISNVIEIMLECKTNSSCHLLYTIYMSVFHKLGYMEYKNKTFILESFS